MYEKDVSRVHYFTTIQILLLTIDRGKKEYLLKLALIPWSNLML